MAISPNIQKLLDQITKECERLTMENIEIYDVKGSSPLTDVVVVATAAHVLQLEAARRSLSLITKQAGYPLQNPTEDYSEGWLVMDCVDLVIHVLISDKRSFYDLDGLMTSIKRSPSQPNDDEYDSFQEPTDAELEEILEHLTEEELEEFLSNAEEDEEKS
ncbi:MAG: ribosome silencing factor [Brevinema sp.]